MTSDDAERSEADRFPGDDLAMAFGAVWQALGDGVTGRHRPFHTPTLVSNGLDGWPKARTVVLRAADASLATLRCHTDRRSPKAAELKADDRVGLLAYDPARKLQVRLQGRATIDLSGPVAEAAWTASTLWARRCYAAPFAPGAATEVPHGNLPDDLRHRQPTEPEAEAGRVNFAAITVAVSRIDWLYLAAAGHRRGVHVKTEGKWTAAWVAP